MKFYDLIVSTSPIKLVYVCAKQSVASPLSPVMTGSWPPTPGSAVLHAGKSCLCLVGRKKGS